MRVDAEADFVPAFTSTSDPSAVASTSLAPSAIKPAHDSVCSSSVVHPWPPNMRWKPPLGRGFFQVFAIFRPSRIRSTGPFF
jgi:hypothetical protein